MENTENQESGQMTPAVSQELDEMDRLMIETVIDKFGGGPVGIETIAAAIGEDRDTLEDVYEPYLMSIGLLTRTPAGRKVTETAYQHLRKKPAK